MKKPKPTKTCRHKYPPIELTQNHETGEIKIACALCKGKVQFKMMGERRTKTDGRNLKVQQKIRNRDNMIYQIDQNNNMIQIRPTNQSGLHEGRIEWYIETCPSDHKSHCRVCRRSLAKGERRFSFQYRNDRKRNQNLFICPNCFEAMNKWINPK